MLDHRQKYALEMAVYELVIEFIDLLDGYADINVRSE